MPVIRIEEFDTWRPGYGFATVNVYRAGTTVLASVFTDEACTITAPNPQTLLQTVQGGLSCGKFSTPLYTQQSYELLINSVDQTGIVRPPLTTLDGEDASQATVEVTGGTQTIPLADHLARAIDTRDFGVFKQINQAGASSSTNTATLVQAIGAASGQGGGIVRLPAGTFEVTSFSIPHDVVIEGAGRGATTLQSKLSGNIVTITGQRAGLRRVTIDGVSQITGSVGVFAEAVPRIILEETEIERFDTGLLAKGMSRCRWRELHLSDCKTGGQLIGDTDNGAGGLTTYNEWHGGFVELCSSIGVEFKWVDTDCRHNSMVGVRFDSNTGTAVKVTGARTTLLRDCQWNGNTTNLDVSDVSPPSDNGTVIGLEVTGGGMLNGAINLAGTLQNVAFRRVDLQGVAITLTTAGNNVLAEDCNEISGVTIGGTTSTAWVRSKTYDRGNSAGLTTAAVATKAWGLSLDDGERVFLVGTVIGRGRNVDQDGFYYIAVSAKRPGASLAYDTQTANFTAGNIVTGQVSGATGRIMTDTDAGTTGTLTLQDVVGKFVDNEPITDGGGGAAVANGTQSHSSAVLVGAVTQLRADQETNAAWAATFVANGPEIELRVTGDNAQTVEWTVDVRVVRS